MKLEDNFSGDFAELSMGERVFECVRWIFVLPAVAVCGIAAKSVVAFGSSASMTGGNLDPENSNVDRLFVVIASNVALGAASVIGGAKVAPRYKVQTAVMLAVLLSFLWGGAFALELAIPVDGWKLAGILSGVLGAVGGAVHIGESRVRERP
jgi:hypothetical protein